MSKGARQLTTHAGANQLEIARTGGTSNSYLTFDQLSAELDPLALQEFQLLQASNGPAAPLANIVRFTNQSARSFSLQDFRTHETSGIAAIQIVNISTDRDSNSIPDSWEIHHGMDATTETDPDLDGLSDWDERMLGSSSGNANSLARPVPHDSTGDGNADSEINGDYAVFLERFANYQSLSAGNGSATPTRTDAARLLMQATFGPTMLDIAQQLRDEINPEILEKHSETRRVRDYPQPLVFWSFLGQVASEDSSCARAVSRVQAWAHQQGLTIPSAGTSSFCEARQALPLAMLQEIKGSLCEQLDANLPQAKLWRGHAVKAEDGTRTPI